MDLMRPTSFQEVEMVVMSMKKNKAPSADGYTLKLFQTCWSFLGKEIHELVEESHQTMNLHPRLNATFFTMISKNSHSKSPNGFQPITLCNVIYKIISNVIVNRINPILPTPIWPAQNGFVKAHQIADRIIMMQ